MNFFPDKRIYHNTKLLLGVQIFLLTLIVIGIFLLFTQKLWLPKVVGYIIEQEDIVDLSTNATAVGERVEDFDLKNAVFTIEENIISLVDGTSEVLITPSSTDKVLTSYLGNEAIGDLNSDKRSDVIFLVTQETSGSGVYYYVVAALREVDGYSTTNGVLIGDRISVSDIYISPDSGVVEIKYFESQLGESLTTKPTVETTLFLRVNENGRLEKALTELEWGIL